MKDEQHMLSHWRKKQKMTAIAAAASDLSNLVFIVGVPRSGTTWLWGLLTSHPNVVPLVREDFDPSKPSVVDGKRVTSETGAFINFEPSRIVEVVTSKSRMHPGKVLLEKTPYHIQKLPEIWALFPKAKVIHCLRDPRAVVCSMLKSDFFDFAASLEEAIKNYKRSYERVAPHLGDERLVTLKYEELTSDTAGQLERVLHFIGLSTDGVEKIVAENRNKSKVEVAGVYRKGEIDSYLRELTPDQISTIEARLARIMKATGYLTSSGFFGGLFGR